MKKMNAALLAVMMSTLFLTAAVVPVVEAAPEPVAQSYDGLDPGTEEAIDWWLRVIPGVNTVKGIYDFFTRDSGSYDPGAGADNAMKAYARNVDSIRSSEQIYNVYSVASNLVDNDRLTWKLTDAYLNRAAEIGAGSMWYEGASFNPDDILAFAGIYASVGDGNYNTQAVLDRAASAVIDLKGDWNGTEYGGSMSISFIWDEGGTGDCSSALYLDFFSLAEVSAGKNLVYLTAPTGVDVDATSHTIWAYTTTGTITPVTPGSPARPLVLGPNLVDDMESGWYILSPGIYGGPFMPSVSERAAPISGAVGLICDESYGYIRTLSDTTMQVVWGGMQEQTSTFDFRISGGADNIVAQNALAGIVRSYSAYMEQLSSLLHEAAESAQVMWTISATARTSNPLLSPASIIPHLKNVDVGPEQSYAMYVAALDQIGQYNTTYGGLLKSTAAKISAQSLDLYCHGSIHASDGTILADNVIFTPYIYIQDWTIYSGKASTLRQDGLAMVWATADSAAGWVPSPATDSYQALILQKGTYFVADQIIYRGAEVPSLHLDVEEISQMEIFKKVEWTRPEPPKVLSAEQLVMMIVIELGAIIALIGYAFKIPQLIIAGAVVALLGFFLSGWIARVALGTEGFWDWLPFWQGGRI